MQRIKTLFKLNECYIGIEDELCNRHTTNFTNIKHKFQTLYEKTVPTFFVLAQGICQFSSSQQHNNQKQKPLSEIDTKCISMTIENGVIIAVAKTQLKGNIYINYNKWQQQADMLYQKQSSHQSNQNEKLQYSDELILNYKGEIKENINLSQEAFSLSNQLKQIYQMAVEDISLNKINGAILYINSNIPSNNFYHQEALIYAFYVSFLKVNNLLEEYSIQDIIYKLISFYQRKQKLPIENNLGLTSLDRICKYSKIFNFNTLNTIIISSRSQYLQKTNNKFLFVKLSNKTFKKNKNEIILQQIIQKQQILLNQIEKGNKKIQQIMKQIKNYYQSLENKYFNQYHVLSKVNKLIEGFFLVEHGQYVVLLVSNSYCAELVRKVAKQLKQQQKNPESSGEQEQKHKDILEIQQRKCGRMIGKWYRNKTSKTNQYIFTSLPSIGFTILDCHQQLWFNE